MTIDDQGNVIFLVTTMREKETVRVISLRRAHANERAIFAEFTNFQASSPDEMQWNPG